MVLEHHVSVVSGARRRFRSMATSTVTSLSQPMRSARWPLSSATRSFLCFPAPGRHRPLLSPQSNLARTGLLLLSTPAITDWYPAVPWVHPGLSGSHLFLVNGPNSGADQGNGSAVDIVINDFHQKCSTGDQRRKVLSGSLRPWLIKLRRIDAEQSDFDILIVFLNHYRVTVNNRASANRNFPAYLQFFGTSRLQHGQAHHQKCADKRHAAEPAVKPGCVHPDTVRLCHFSEPSSDRYVPVTDIAFPIVAFS